MLWEQKSPITVDKLSVVLVAIFGVLALGERPSLAGWLGIAMIGGGAALIASGT